MTYQEVLTNIGNVSEREAGRLIAEYRAGRLTREQFVAMATAFLQLANEQGRIAAETAFMGWLLVNNELPKPAGVKPIPHYGDAGRLQSAVETIIDGPAEQMEQRMLRLAHSEAIESSQKTFGDAIAGSPKVKGWKRGQEPDACELCNWWSQGGKTWHKQHPMPTHKGCVCTQIPVTTGPAPLWTRRR